MNNSRTYHIWTQGCQMNEADSRRLAQQLEFIGYTPGVRAEDADLVVLNTCVVRQQAEDKAVGRLTTLKAAKMERPGMVIGLMGCMVGMREAPALKERYPFVDVFMPPSETAPLLDFLRDKGLFANLRAEEVREFELRSAIQNEDLPVPAQERGQVMANVPVVLGCSHACTFCVIPYRRGAERSRPAEDILRECESLVRQGVREIMLLGQIVDRYGLDLPDMNLSKLLRRIADIEGLHRIRFLTSHPNYMTDELLETVASVHKVCPQIEVPAQAGNDVVLENMKRGYTAQNYRDLITRIRRFVPDAAIHTDIIVGFPGETDEQFMDTYRLIEELRMDKIHLSKYSERPKTIAARKMPDDISQAEKDRRWQAIEELQTKILDEKNQEWRGREVEVLVEDRYKGKWRGRTRHAKLVFFEDARELRGQLVKVNIDWAGPFSLLGTSADAPRGIRRLELAQA